LPWATVCWSWKTDSILPKLRSSGAHKDLSPKFLWGAATAAHQVEGNNINSDAWLLEHLPHSMYKEHPLKTYWPLLSGVAEFEIAVPSFVIVNLAFCTTAPVWSVTVPRTCAV